MFRAMKVKSPSFRKISRSQTLFFLIVFSVCSAQSITAQTAELASDSAIHLAYSDAEETSTKTEVSASKAAKVTMKPYLAAGAGYRDLNQYFEKSMRYPDEARMRGESGVVRVQFDIMSNGEIANIHVLDTAQAALAQEAMRLVESMPRWQPAYAGSIPVKTRHQVNVKFSLR